MHIKTEEVYKKKREMSTDWGYSEPEVPQTGQDATTTSRRRQCSLSHFSFFLMSRAQSYS